MVINSQHKIENFNGGPALFVGKKKGAPSLERPQNSEVLFDFFVNTAA